jgi:hypothetical protein
MMAESQNIASRRISHCEAMVQRTRFHGNKLVHKNRGNVGSGVFCVVYAEDYVKMANGWNCSSP